MNGSSPSPVYRSFGPSPALRRFAEAIWVQHCAPTPDAEPTTIVPTGRVDLVFCYRDRFARAGDGGLDTLPAAHAVGQRRQPLVVRSMGGTGIVILRLKPWGARALFGEEILNCGDHIVDLELLWGRAPVEGLLDRLAAASIRQRARIADAFVVERVKHERIDPLAPVAVDAINCGWGRQSIARLADRFDLGRRQFNRRFTRAIGASPKQISRVLRAQKALVCLRSGVDVSTVIDRCGFSDQSHLIRDVVAHAGKKPGELIRLAPSGPHRFFNANGVDAFCGMTYL